jgi:hypothetical protein
MRQASLWVNEGLEIGNFMEDHLKIHRQRQAKHQRLLLEYDCPRCGDRFECANDDDLFAVTAHRLLHQAGAWKRSLFAKRSWVEDGISAQAMAE